MHTALLKRTTRLGYTTQIQDSLYALVGRAYFQLTFFTLWPHKQGGWWFIVQFWW